MPELPEVETVRRGLAPHVEGQSITGLVIRQTKLRYPVDAKLLEAKLIGQKILHLKRRAKYLLLEFEHGTLLIHLGMTGVVRILADDTPLKKHDHVDFILENVLLRFNDTRRFGMIIWLEDTLAHPLLRNLGEEPLSLEFHPEALAQKLKKTRRPIKLALMDQAVVVGVGNIYANEALYAAKIHPERCANSLKDSEIKVLVEAVKAVLEKAIAGGGTTLKDFLSVEGKPGYFRHELKIYGRSGKPCEVCKTPIQKVVLGQRATYFCSQCQKL